MTRFVTASASVYSCLLRLCPSELRAEFGEEMTLVFADDLADSFERGGPAAASRVCFRAAGELARLAGSNALSIYGVLTSLIASAVTMICFTAELAVARAHGPTPISTAPAYVLVIMGLIPSVTAGFVALIAVRLARRTTPQRLLN
jgi:hypothetical protein